jgi:hypothetical protein
VQLGPNATLSGTTNILLRKEATLDVSGLAAGFTVMPSQHLTGEGTVNGKLLVSGTLAPANADSGLVMLGGGIGYLTNSSAYGVVFSPGSTNRFDMNITNALVCDRLVQNGGSIQLGGALEINNTGPQPTNGTILHLYQGSLSGQFDQMSLPHGSPHWVTADLVSNGSIIFTNRLPTASTLTLGASTGVPQTLAIIGGKHAPVDPEGDTMTITAVTQGAYGTVSSSSSNVTYTATGGGTTDSFSYTVTDAFGGNATGTVNVTLVPSGQGFNRVGDPVSLGGDDFKLTYYGVPGLKYSLDWSGDLSTWVPQVTNTVGANGSLIFTNNQTGSPNFWRTRYVP